MNTLLDQLEGSASTSTCLAFGSVSGEEIRFARIWSDSATSASWFSALLPDGAPVAMVLNASRACITALLGAWRAGLTVLSLPDPTRMAGATYSALLKQISDSHGDLYLLTERTRVDALPEMTAVHPVDFETAAFGGSGRRRESVGSFIQYTSGSTRSPAGVVLDLAAMASGISGIIDRIAPYLPDGLAGARVCSWLPMSHDMGLIGGCLTAVVAGGATPEGTGTLLIEPSAFVRRPTMWLRSCAEFGASITLSSAHGLELATRVAPKLERIDISTIEAILVGGEMIRPETLDRFVDAYAKQGLRRSSLRPAYGMAENTLAVTIGLPRDESNLRPRPRSGGEPDEASRSVVSCGPPIVGTEVRISSPDAEGVGEVAIRGASLFRGYTASRTARYEDGWFLTGDLGFIDDGELYPLGRSDDMIVVRGMNLMPLDIESVIDAELGAACRNVAAVQYGPHYAVIIEARDPDQITRVVGAIRSLCTRAVGIGPERIVAVGKRGLPLTPSGKVQRSLARARLLNGDLPIAGEHQDGAARSVEGRADGTHFELPLGGKR